MALPKNCPLCHASIEKQRVVTPHVFGQRGSGESAFFYCCFCDVRYQHPGLTPDEEAQFYTAEFEGFMASRAGSEGGWNNAEEHILANEQNRSRRMRYLEPLINVNSTILEVGCSSGFMLYPLVEVGHSCTAIEPSGVFSDYVQNRGLEVYESMEQLNGLSSHSRFDIVMHFFVLEHIAAPLKFLEAQLNLLEPGGKIVFEVPNAADPLYSVYDIQAFERFYWSKAHPWYFSEKSLSYLLSQVGAPYEIVRDQRYDLSNHIVWARDGKPGGMGKFNHIFGAEMDASYKQALIKSGKCDTLVAIISKD